MTEPTVDLLTSLRNDAFLDLVSGAVVLAISGGSLLHKHITKKKYNIQEKSIQEKSIQEKEISIIPSTLLMSSDLGTRSILDLPYYSTSTTPTSSINPYISTIFQFSYGLGLVYGTTNIIKGTTNLIKYSTLLSEAKLPRYQLSFYLSIPFENLIDGNPGARSFYPYGTRFPSKTARFNIGKFVDAVTNFLNGFDIKLISLDIEDVDTGSSTSTNTISSNVKIDITFIITKKLATPASIISNILDGTLSINGYTLNISADKSPTLNADIQRNV